MVSACIPRNNPLTGAFEMHLKHYCHGEKNKKCKLEEGKNMNMTPDRHILISTL